MCGLAHYKHPDDWLFDIDHVMKQTPSISPTVNVRHSLGLIIISRRLRELLRSSLIAFLPTQIISHLHLLSLAPALRKSASAMATTFPDPMHVPQQIPGKGKGLVATRLIPRGTRILRNKPSVPLPPPVNEELVSNCLTWYDFPANFRDIPECDKDFLRTCGINHACDHNAAHHYNYLTRMWTVHAVRDIQKGEEITINYLWGLEMFADRQSQLWDEFGIRCICNLCILPDSEMAILNAIAASLYGCKKAINELESEDVLVTGTGEDRITLLRASRMIAAMYDDQGPHDGGAAQIYLFVAKIAIIDGDLARGKVFAERAMAEFTTLEGDDCRTVVKQGYLARDPASFVLHGVISARPSKVNDVPTGLSDDDFEDWLWEFLEEDRHVPSHNGMPLESELAPVVSSMYGISPGVHTTANTMLVNLRNRTIFLSWSGLPHEKGLHLSPYHATKNHKTPFTPKSHWCLVGEITSFVRLRRLELHIKDPGGTNTFHVIFRTGARGDEIPHNVLIRGNAVAVLYPLRYNNKFKHHGSGIQLTDQGMIKVGCI